MNADEAKAIAIAGLKNRHADLFSEIRHAAERVEASIYYAKYDDVLDVIPLHKWFSADSIDLLKLLGYDVEVTQTGHLRISWMPR